jgi:type I restriction enzyme R subunit
MWLTGFDAPTISTLYLDKPQKGHTLMQTIARANRVSSHRIDGVEKRNGEIIDYCNVIERLKKAVKDYGEGDTEEGDSPVKNKEELFKLLDEAIEQAKAFCDERGIDIVAALKEEDVFTQVALFEQWANIILTKDEWWSSFKVYENTATALFEACKPEILGRPVVKTVALLQYLRGVVAGIIEQADVDAAIQRTNELLDQSLVVSPDTYAKEGGAANERYSIRRTGKTWDLSKIDFDHLRSEFKAATHKNIEIADLRAFISQKSWKKCSRRTALDATLPSACKN